LGALFTFDGFGFLFTEAGPICAIFFNSLGVTAYKELTERHSRRKLQRELEGRTSPQFVKEVLRDPDRMRRPRKVEATIMFSDVSGFTQIAESMAPERIVEYLHQYHERISRIILRHGYLDKYVGDGIMAVFGVPVYSPQHAHQACWVALESISSLEELNRAYRAQDLPPVSLRIGINTGEMVAGYVGSSERSEFTVMGDSVNLAAHLEEINKIYGTKIIIGESTWGLVKESFYTRQLDCIRAIGKKKAVRIYELMARKGDLDLYTAGLKAYHTRDWDHALRCFKMAMERDPNDIPTQIYYQRCLHFIKYPPPGDWDGVFEVSRGTIT
jgi:adenylate cyclase